MTHIYEKWNEEPFVSLRRKIEGRTLLPPLKTYTLWELARSCANIDGEVAELGVFRGGTAKIIASVMGDKKFHLFDTFQGLPKPCEFDHMKEGALKADEGLVREFLKDHNVEFHVGFFPETTKGLENKKFCFVHSDADFYHSTMDSCEFFYPRLNKCGMMVFDDYALKATDGCRKAVDEFFKDKPENPVYLTTKHAFVVKQ